jgi:hypothetical protein
MLFRFCLAGLAFVLAGALALGPARTYTEQCPAKTSQMDDVIAVLDQAPSCDRAMKLFEACEYGASGDVQFGAIVEKKCEADFLSRLKAPQKQAYQREMGACDRKYENESGTMYRSFTAFCRAESPSATRVRRKKDRPASAPLLRPPARPWPSRRSPGTPRAR